MTLTRADILKAIKIRKLIYQARRAEDPERAAFLAKAEQLRGRYRYGQRMHL
jgi:hypothetical protein